MKRTMTTMTILAVSLLGVLIPPSAFAADDGVSLQKLGRYASGRFGVSALEIAAYDAGAQRIYVVNGSEPALDVIDIANPREPKLLNRIDLSQWGKGVNSVDVHDGLVAAAVENASKDQPGTVAFLNRAGDCLAAVAVGVLPDMVTFTPDGAKVLTANEGEPLDDYSKDPEGSISIIDVSGGVENLTQDSVQTVSFAGLTREDLPAGVRIFSPKATPAQDLEPEYIAVSADSSKAWVTLQENNALAVVDINAAKLERIIPLGFKDYSQPANGLDTSDKDGAIRIELRPVFGMYQPDAIVAFQAKGATYLLTANEGDSRDYAAFSEEARVADLALDPEAFPEAETLQSPAELGRLKVTNTMGDTDGDGDFDALYAYGARSFTVWSTDGKLVYDSGDKLERLTAEALPEDFNSDADENGSFDSRSDDKGPEPEGAVVGMVGGAPYGFIGLERVGGVVVVNLSDPKQPSIEGYYNSRDFGGDPKAGTAGDLSPEGLCFIAATESPTGTPLLAVANEVSGSLVIYEIVANQSAESE